jgi:cellobiose transport system substrate-binding protein
MKWTRSRGASALAIGAASAILLSACSSSDPVASPSDDVTTPASTPEERPEVTLDIAYFGTFGFDVVSDQYEAENPNVTLNLIEAEFNAHHDGLQAALIAGSGASPITAIDTGFMAGFLAQSEGFVNLLDLGAGKYEENYLPWKWQEGSNADKSVTIGLGSDVGGLALCYRRDLFEAAGLPTDRAEVDALIGDTWEGFVAAGEQYVAGAGDGKYFVDNASNINTPALTQLGIGYYNRNNELDMDPTKPAFDTALSIIEAGLSANIAPWSPEWNTGFSDGTFAVLACPAWMMGYIQSQVDAEAMAGSWDVADIPGPGGNWGGSFYTIPNQFDEATTQEAYRFIEYIIQPDQQIAIFQELGNLPSQSSLYSNPGIQEFSNPFFNDAPVGQIFSKSASDIPGAIYYAPKNQDIANAVGGILGEVQNGNVAIADAWDAAVAAAEAADAA